MIISEGKINQAEMNKNRLTLDELAVEMRKQNITDISKIRHAVLESDGTLSILLYAEESPLTPSDMGISVDDPDYPLMIVSDGRTLSDNMHQLGLDDRWLSATLKKYKVKSAKEVYLLTCDKGGKTYFAKKEQSK